MNRSDCDLVWSGATIAPGHDYHERGELLDPRHQQECSALAKLISPFELEQLEHRKLREITTPHRHHRPEGA